MKRKHYQRSPQGEANRLKAIPKGKDHWRYSENPTVSAVHRWINKWYGRATKCESKKHDHSQPVKKFDWALIHGKKYEKNRWNFKQLCRSCHTKYDFTDERRKKIGISTAKRHALNRKQTL